MNSSENPRRKFGRQYFAALARDAKRRAEDRLRRRRSEADQQLSFDQTQLRFQPRTAGSDLPRIWFPMNPAFPAGLLLKMLHRVRDINFFAINSGFFERLIHDFPSRPDEWLYRRYL